MAEQLDNIKNFIEKYCKILHLAHMPAATRARFDKYAAAKDFDGDMKRWVSVPEGEKNSLLDFADALRAGNVDDLPTLTDDKWRDLYNRFQAIFENMDQNSDDFKYKDETTKKFFTTWFGDDKLFKPRQPAVPGLEERIEHFAKFLEDHKFALSSVISDKQVYGLDGDFNYDSFVNDIKAGKYKKDPKLRDQLFAVVKYTQSYSDGSNPYYPWGKNVPAYDFSTETEDGKVALPLDTDEWFAAKYNPAFKHRAREIFDKLVTSSVVREDFANYDYKGKVAKFINQAITETDYDNKDSKDYVAPLYKDEQTFWNKVSDKVKEFKENNIDPWANILRGQRLYFSDFAKAIIEASSKAKNKDGKKLSPVDGLQGILDYGDAITAKLVEKSPKGKSHFEWLKNKLKIYAEKMSDAFAGAFYKPRKLKKIVSQIIVDGIQENKIAEAKTAMEVLSTLKYGIFHSGLVDALTKEEFKPLSDLSVSKKYEAMGVLAKGLEGAAKYTILGVARIVAAIHNGIFRRTTKFNGKTKYIDAAHDVWKQHNSVDSINASLYGVQTDLAKQKENKTLNDTAILTAAGGRGIKLGDAKAYLKGQVDDYNKLDQELKKLQTQVEQAPYIGSSQDEIDDWERQIAEKESALAALSNITNYQKLLQQSEDIESNIELLDAEQDQLKNIRDNWGEKHQDKFVDLMAFWDMLETYNKSHVFSFGMDKVRKKFLDPEQNKDAYGKQIEGDDGKAISMAQSRTIEFQKAYHDKYFSK